MKVFFVRHGQTQTNIDKKSYTFDDNQHPLTDRGKLQAIHTGKYLKTFGNFDLVISSPKLRALQTAELICKEIDYNKDIMKNILISEEPGKFSCGLTHIEVMQQIIFKNKENKKNYFIIKKKIEETNDPIDKFKLLEQKKIEFRKVAGMTSNIDYENNLTLFLNQLKQLKHKCILVVSHGEPISILQYMITNTTFNTNIYLENANCINPEDIEGGNTMILALKLINNKFKLVIPKSTLHLKNIDNLI